MQNLRTSSNNSVFSLINLLYTAVILCIILFFILPVGNLLFRGILVFLNKSTPLPQNLPVYMIKVTRNTLLLGILTTFWTLLLALPASIFIVKYNIRYSGLWTTLLAVPMITPVYISSFAIIILFGRSGVITILLKKIGIEFPTIYGLNGLIITQILHTAPYAVLILIAGLKGIPRHLEESALSMGASIMNIQFSIIIPYIMPQILMSSLLVFLSSIGDIGSPLIIGGNYDVLSLSIYSNYISFLDDDRIPMLLSLWIIIISFLIMYVVNRIFQITNKRYRIGYDTMVYDIPVFRNFGLLFVAVLTILFLIPYIVILIHSFSKVWISKILPSELTFNNYLTVFNNIDIILNTLILSAIAVPIMIVIGLIISHMFRKINKLKWLNYITLIPSVLPGVIIAISLLKTFSDLPFFGDFLTSPFVILLIAVSIRRLPYVIKTLEAGFCRIDLKQAEIAEGFGATDFKVFFTILFPQLKPIIISAIFIATVKVFIELSSSLIINPPGWQTMSVFITHYVEEGLISRASAMSVVIIIIVLSGSFISKYFSRKTSKNFKIASKSENMESVILGKGFDIKDSERQKIDSGGIIKIIRRFKEVFKGNIFKRASITVDRDGKIMNTSDDFLHLISAGSVEHLKNAANLYNLLPIKDDIRNLFSTKKNIEDKSIFLFNLQGERMPVNISLQLRYAEDKKKQVGVVFITPESRNKRHLREYERLKALADEAELKALKAQINPHFFFNTLNSIVELIETEPDKAVTVTESLAELFRFTLMSTQKNSVLLSEEIDHIKEYLSIFKVRFGDRLSYNIRISNQVSGCKIPPMLIQPIVENAIYHGNDDRGNIDLSLNIWKENYDIFIKVSDKGTSSLRYSDLISGKGTGLKNVENRLQTLFKQGLVFENNNPSGLSITIIIPEGSNEY